MLVNEYFNQVQEVEDAAHAAGGARPEWPAFGVWARFRPYTLQASTIAAQELGVKLLKHGVEDLLAAELPSHSLVPMLSNPAAAIAGAARRWAGSRSLAAAWGLAEEAGSASLSASWLYGVCDFVVSAAVEAGKALYAAWRDGGLRGSGGGDGGGEGGSSAAGALISRALTTAADVAARAAPAVLPLLTIGSAGAAGPVPLLAFAGVAAAGAGAALHAALPPAAWAGLSRAVRGQALRCATALAWGTAGSALVSLVRPEWAAWAYTVAQLASWHVLVGPALAHQAEHGRTSRPAWLAAGVAAAAVGVLHSFGKGGAAVAA
jgi:hypothetical protein